MKKKHPHPCICKKKCKKNKLTSVNIKRVYKKIKASHSIYFY
jgi:hypothetical protein